MKKRLIFGAFFLSMFFAACFSIGVYARENTIVKDYAGLTLTCYINCTNTSGTGSTDGAGMDGYRNYIKVITYDIDQNYIGASESYSIIKATAKVTKGFPYLTRTYHAAADTYNNQLLPAYQQIQQAQGR